MDKQFLQEHNLTDAQRKFQLMVEYSYVGASPIEEDGPEGNMPPVGGNSQDPAMPPVGPGGDGGAMPPMGDGANGPEQMGGAPADPNAMPPAGPEDPNAMPPTGGEGVEGFAPQVDTPQVDTDGNEVSTEDEIIDVDELTDTQEEVNDKVTNVDRKLDKFLDVVNKLVDDIDKNNEHIEQLRQDFEKRNPTQVEKMTLRAKQGYPFSQSPDEFWEKKEAEGNYSTDADMDGVDDKRYQITKNDINNVTDWASIYKSIDDGTFHQDLKDILNF